MAELSALRDGLKTRLATISGLRAFDTIPGSFSPPAALIALNRIDYDEAMARGLDAYEFTVRIYIAIGADAQSQDALDAYVNSSGSTSVKAAIEGERTWGGVIQTCRVTTVGAVPTIFEHGETSYLGAEFTVAAWARG